MKKTIFCLLFLWVPFAQAESCFKKEMSVDQLTQCAGKGDVEAQANLGSLYEHGQGVQKDYKKAFEWYTKAAQQNYPMAQSNLALLYYHGKGLKQDYKKAVELFSKATEQGYVPAISALGWMYYEGDGVEKDLKKAYDLSLQAAEKGDAYSQDTLARMHETGAGAPKDLVLAYMWYNLALLESGEYKFEKDDSKKTKADFESLTKKMTPEQIAKAKQMTQDWLAKHPPATEKNK